MDQLVFCNNGLSTLCLCLQNLLTVLKSTLDFFQRNNGFWITFVSVKLNFFFFFLGKKVSIITALLCCFSRTVLRKWITVHPLLVYDFYLPSQPLHPPLQPAHPLISPNSWWKPEHFKPPVFKQYQCCQTSHHDPSYSTGKYGVNLWFYQIHKDTTLSCLISIMWLINDTVALNNTSLQAYSFHWAKVVQW